MKDLRKVLKQQQQLGLYRRRRCLESPQGREITVDGQRLLNFCSNDYLGLASHPGVVQRFQAAASDYGVGSGSAHLVNGHSRAHHALEEELADFTGYPRALLFSTGYMANLAAAQSLCSRGDYIVEDKLNHASLIDAAQLSGAKLLRYQHNHMQSLQQQLGRCESTEILISSDAVFSMDGDQANIPRLVEASQQHAAWLMLDDAHGFGVLGEHGRGSLSQQQVSTADVPVYMATLGKAMGTAGAFIAGTDELIEYLIQTARSYIYTTAMPAAIAEASRASLQIIRNDNSLQQSLLENIRYFRQLAQQAGLKLTPSETAIQPLIIGDASNASAISQQLFQEGLHIAAIRPPTVPQGTARLRITLRADHTHKDIDQLLVELQRHLPST